jgi:hypothetical protein
MPTLDISYQRAIALIGDVEPRLSNIVTEEDAKLQLVVRFLTEILGWDHADLSTERKNENGYSDYIVSNNGQPSFLVEAKRQGQLELATTATKKQLYKISGPALQRCLAGIEQAASYCAPEGIQLAVVTDGTKWILFKPYIASQSYKLKEAIVFPTLQSITADFAIFFEFYLRMAIDGLCTNTFSTKYTTVDCCLRLVFTQHTNLLIFIQSINRNLLLI